MTFAIDWRLSIKNQSSVRHRDFLSLPVCLPVYLAFSQFASLFPCVSGILLTFFFLQKILESISLRNRQFCMTLVQQLGDRRYLVGGIFSIDRKGS